MKTETQGELACRIKANRRRLSDDIYRYPEVFRQKSEWDGDWEGRALLSLCCLYRICAKEERDAVLIQMKEMVSHLDEYTNADGYFGKVFDGKTLNEQQLSGNSWFIRGLCEFYRITFDERVLFRIRHICKKYLELLKDYYPAYPLCEREEGDVGGHLGKEKSGDWLLSSDVGCAFIMLDGVTDAYRLCPSDELREVLETILKRYLELDFVGVHCQTHATLSGLRGLLRYYETTGDAALLAQAERIFSVYTAEGMTLNYANYNWFGKPFWTEPCAVVDSLIVTSELFRFTKNPEYIRLMNRIYLNALRSGQRTNGGAGCETCLTPDSDGMRIHLYEAFFCCTMRLSEGLQRLNDFCCYRENDTVYLPLWEDFTATDDGLSVQMRINGTQSEGRICLAVESDKPVNIRLYLPYGTVVNGTEIHTDGFFATFKAETGIYDIGYSRTVHTEERFGHKVAFSGDVLLSRKNGSGEFTSIADCMRCGSRAEEEALVQHFWLEKIFRG